MPSPGFSAIVMSWCGWMSQWEEGRCERGHVEPRLLGGSFLSLFYIGKDNGKLHLENRPPCLPNTLGFYLGLLSWEQHTYLSSLTLHQFPIQVALCPLDRLKMWGSSVPSNTTPVEFPLNDSGLMGKEGLSVWNQRECVYKQMIPMQKTSANVRMKYWGHRTMINQPSGRQEEFCRRGDIKC